MSIINWLEQHMLTCPTKKYLHIDCPGCGMQRSFILLLKGDLHHSFQMYPALIPFLMLATLAVLHLVFKFKNGATLLKYFQLGVALIIGISYIYKIIHLKMY